MGSPCLDQSLGDSVALPAYIDSPRNFIPRDTMLDHFLNAFATLLVTIDPVGNVPIFMALIAGFSRAVQLAITVRAAMIAGLILLFFAFAGEPTLSFLGVSLPALQISGGILLFLVALDMIFERRNERKQRTADRATQDQPTTESDWQSLAIFPLAIPMLAGSGSMTSLLVLTAQHPVGSVGFWISLLALGIVLSMFIGLMALTIALGDRVNKQVYLVLTRLMGVILAALSTQFIISGVKTAFGL